MRLVNHHYDMKWINRAFLIGAILLLGTWIWAAWDDYSKPYKTWQRSFYEVYDYQLALEEQNVWTPEKRQQLRELKQERQELQQKIDQEDSDVSQLQEKLEKFEQSELSQQESKVSLARTRLSPVEYEYQKAKGRAESNPDYEVPDELKQRFQQLKRKAEQAQTKLAEMREKADQMRQEIQSKKSEITKLEEEVRDLTEERDVLRAERQRVGDNWINTILEAPIINFINPRTEVKQIQTEGLYMDYNFDRVPRRDFCKSCHMGIDKKAFNVEDGEFTSENTQEAFNQVFSDKDRRNVMKSVFKQHPNYEVIGSPEGEFPFSEYGCTSCHMGNGRALDFKRAAHTPETKKERKEWKKRYDWKPSKHWSWPMLQTKYLDASLPQFYDRENRLHIPNADKVNEGYENWRNYGCNNCHNVDGLNYQRKIGFTLENIQSKLDRDWVKRWVERPKDFNSNTRMPQVFHRFNLDDPEQRAKSTAIIHSITEYLYSKSDTVPLDPAPPERGNAKRGEQLFKERGCTGCHSMQSEGIETSNAAPDLSHIGSKVDRRWLYNWLKNPREIWPETHMPNMRLNDQQANDITEWLLQQKHPDWSADNYPTELPDQYNEEDVLGEQIEQMARSFIGRTNGPRTTEKRIEELKQEAREQGIDERKRLARFVGKQSVDYHGCSSCHMIDGHEGYNRIGPSLEEKGTQGLHMLSFGQVDIPHTRQHFIDQKLKQPGIYDKGQVNGYLENLRMPKPNLNDQQRESVVTFVLSLRDPGLVEESRIHKASPGQKMSKRGQELVREFNCQSCHQIHEQAPMTEYLQEYYQKKLDNGEELSVGGESVNSANNMAHYQTAPTLKDVGKRLDEEWIFSFLKNPQHPDGREQIRTWQHLRMPQYNFSDKEASEIAQGFTYQGWGERPTKVRREAQIPNRDSVVVGNALFNQQCSRCHIAEGDEEFHTPQMTPNLNYIGEKFDYRGFKEWVREPGAFVPDGVSNYRHRGMVGLREWDITQDYLEDNLDRDPGPVELDGRFDSKEEQLEALRDYIFHHRLGVRQQEE